MLPSIEGGLVYRVRLCWEMKVHEACIKTYIDRLISPFETDHILPMECAPLNKPAFILKKKKHLPISIKLRFCPLVCLLLYHIEMAIIKMWRVCLKSPDLKCRPFRIAEISFGGTGRDLRDRRPASRITKSKYKEAWVWIGNTKTVSNMSSKPKGTKSILQIAVRNLWGSFSCGLSFSC